MLNKKIKSALFLATYSCVSMAADASQRKALRYQQTVVSHHLCLCSLSHSHSLSLTFSSFWLLFRQLWIAVLLSFEIIWSQRCCTISAWLVWLESLCCCRPRGKVRLFAQSLVYLMTSAVCTIFFFCSFNKFDKKPVYTVVW